MASRHELSYDTPATPPDAVGGVVAKLAFNAVAVGFGALAVFGAFAFARGTLAMSLWFALPALAFGLGGGLVCYHGTKVIVSQARTLGGRPDEEARAD